MDLEFDKEIDALLRKARSDKPTFFGQLVSPHLDADELSAFAENVMPEAAKRLQTTHLAECDRCRKILSDLILMTAEAAPAASPAVSVTVIEESIPWYRKLLLFPNLAYAMGAFVLVFGAGLAFLILQNSGSRYAEVSQGIDDSRTAHGPNIGFGDSATASNTAAANKTTNAVSSGTTAANTNSSTANLMKPADIALDGESATLPSSTPSGAGVGVASDEPPKPVAAAPPVSKDAPTESVERKRKEEDKLAAAAPESMKKTDDMTAMRDASTIQGGPSKRKGPSQNRSENRTDTGLRAEESVSAPVRRQSGGKTFEMRQGVWYDLAYRGGGTSAYRRGTSDYLRLDSGLRNIADNFYGTVVVVWNDKAYRIQ